MTLQPTPLKFVADKPLSRPEEDLLGHSNFAKTIAKGILEMTPPEGLVISINGDWGSGKTSVLNLIEYYVQEFPAEANPIVIRFNPWWFPGYESLCHNFFSLLESNLYKLNRSLSS